MGNNIWKNFNRERMAIQQMSYFCHNCATLTDLQSGTDYIYFACNQSFNDTDEKFFSKDFISWKCNKCLLINLNVANSMIPKSIVPKSSEYSEIKEITNIKDEILKELIKEFYSAKKLSLRSAATLLARKILMHIAVDQKLAKEGVNFLEYVSVLKESDLIGRNWKNRIDRIRQLGNDETHNIKIASPEELDNISEVIKNLLSNIYLTPVKSAK
ncbi:hypothetical protein LD119_00329 [Mesoplasma sp. JKS002660]|uniref:DUF4145 domain-containing protein n=1 Tax=Mesoplasma whartonense TaxID=2878854 RepID=UPI002022AB3C|nr:DUF4145 domain-containing protein [Mesoplasma sp. JKS002660]MCL8213401.1 hypothetical protein [Mesoplasma sp. JKS002660]